MITLDFSNLHIKLRQASERTQVFDPVRKKWVVLTPEEHVRQYLLQYMIQGMGYPQALIAVEKRIISGQLKRRFDIIVYNREHRPWMLVECKEPEVPVTDDTLFQLLAYQRTASCRYWTLSNGHQHFCADASDPSKIKWLEDLPPYNG